MRILVLGAGAREHALLRGLKRSSSAHELHVAPGNAGMQKIACCHKIKETDADSVVALASNLHADLVIIGPEAPLVSGIADALRQAGFAVFGPSQAAAQLEGSKAFAKEVMKAAGVRTASSQVIKDASLIDATLDSFGPKWVVKSDGLAGGKGVVVTQDRQVAYDHAKATLDDGVPVLFESFLDGPEVSLFCLVDGTTVVPLLPAQDHKRAYDNDEGPNTGGMGAYTPLPWLPDDAVERIVAQVCQPVAEEMVRRGTPYSGLLYAGLAWGEQGPAVVEFNARFGDPETQAVLALLKTPLADLLHATATGTLDKLGPLEWEDGAALTVVLAAEGYPASPRKGDVISGIPQETEEAWVLHAGTTHNEQGELVSTGGRVLSIVAKGKDAPHARKNAYEVVEQISLPGSFYRKDIALRAVSGEIKVG